VTLIAPKRNLNTTSEVRTPNLRAAEFLSPITIRCACGWWLADFVFNLQELRGGGYWRFRNRRSRQTIRLSRRPDLRIQPFAPSGATLAYRAAACATPA
jgi:hypothetical protein